MVPSDSVSVIGHESTAQAFSAVLGFPVAMNRVAISLNEGDTLYVGTLFTAGGKPYRAPEGAVLTDKDLASVEIRFRKVEVGSPARW
jgi:D-alanine-D-alanine ligase-like ATP-grasp enzyme